MLQSTGTKLAFRAFCIFCSIAFGSLSSNSSARAAATSRDIEQFHRLSQVTADAREIALLEFARPCWYCRQKKLRIEEVLELAASRPLTEEELTYTKSVLQNPASFVFGPAKACGPFLPEFGLSFKLKKVPFVLLVSRSCQTARLIMEPDRVPYFFNVDPSLQDLQKHLRFRQGELQ